MTRSRPKSTLPDSNPPAFEQVISPRQISAWVDANACLLRIAYWCGNPAVQQIVELAEAGVERPDESRSRLFFLAVDEYRRAIGN